MAFWFPITPLSISYEGSASPLLFSLLLSPAPSGEGNALRFVELQQEQPLPRFPACKRPVTSTGAAPDLHEVQMPVGVSRPTTSQVLMEADTGRRVTPATKGAALTSPHSDVVWERVVFRNCAKLSARFSQACESKIQCAARREKKRSKSVDVEMAAWYFFQERRATPP